MYQTNTWESSKNGSYLLKNLTATQEICSKGVTEHFSPLQLLPT